MAVPAWVKSRALLHESLRQARPGLALEFGVGTGGTLRTIAAHRPGQTHGFDSFEGLPETWRPGHPQGIFKCKPPDVPGAQLHIGLFADTLPEWKTHHQPADVGFIHIDCDLYSSTATVLGHLTNLQPGTVIQFDELTGYPEWAHHEHRALVEWIINTGTRLKHIGTEGQRAAFITT